MFHHLPNFAWADGNLAEAAGQLGKMGEHRNPSQPNPGLRGHGTPCINNIGVSLPVGRLRVGRQQMPRFPLEIQDSLQG